MSEERLLREQTRITKIAGEPSDASLRLETQFDLFILDFRFSSFRPMDR
jgi:hypothetical protein